MKFKWLLAMFLTFALVLGGCSNTEPTTPSTEGGEENTQQEEEVVKASVKDGTYTTSAKGRNASITVETTFADGKITNVNVTNQMETSVYTAKAIPRICADIVEANSVDVDVIAGATYTSRGIMLAVENAIEEAGAKASDFPNQKETTKGADEEISVDVAVVGAGASGITAAAVAAQNGANVVLIEKSYYIGGASLQSFGMTAYGGTPGIESGEDTNAIIAARFTEWIEHEHYRADGSLLSEYLNNSGRTVDWLNNNGYGMTYFPMFGNGFYMMFGYEEREPAYWNILNNAKVDVRTETKATELLKSGDTVNGVVCERADGSKLTVHAKSVVIATGGNGGDTALITELTGFNGVPGGIMADKGEGMKMAWAVGAKKPTNLGGLMMHQTLATADLVDDFPLFQARMPMILCYAPSFLNVSKTGVRFRNEGLNNVAVAASNAAAFTGGNTYVVLSQSQVDTLVEKGLVGVNAPKSGMPPEYNPEYDETTPFENFPAVLEAMVAQGTGYKGNTVEELAKNAGFDVDTFVNKFNQ